MNLPSNLAIRIRARLAPALVVLALGPPATATRAQTPAAQQSPAARAPSASPLPVLYTLDRSGASTIRDRAPGYVPTYVVYADAQRDSVQARALLDELGIAPHLEEYKARALVVGPVDGVAYDAVADLAAFQDLLRARRSSNLKLIGVGRGATFVNDVLSGYSFAVAGILTYGGSVAPGVAASIPVPAYVHAADPGVARLYLQANGATQLEDESPARAVYRNPGRYQGLQRVAVSKLADSEESLAQAFRNAWRTVFSRNYRLYMVETESYQQAFDPNDHREPWPLEPYVMYDELGVRHEAVTEELPGLGLSLRYEYVPERALSAAPRSVPLVVMLHGNNNDPRIQGESSGWVEVAAEHTLILTSIEWQGRTAQGTTFAAVGEPGTMALIDRLLARYPQIDPGRVYFTGLSAGAMNSFTYGLRNVTRIAGIAGASSPFGPPAVIELAAQARSQGHRLPLYAIAGTRDEFRPLPVNTTPRSFYNVVRSFAELNGIAVPAAPDLEANEMFGVRLDGQAWGELGGRRAMIGTLSNDQGVVIKLVGLDPYAHWNYKPAAADMWAFLSRFRRDTATGALQVTPAR